MIVLADDLFDSVKQLVGDKETAVRWFVTANPLMFGRSPAELIDAGCERLLRSIIAEAWIQRAGIRATA